MWSAWRSCLSVYLDLSPRGMVLSIGCERRKARAGQELVCRFVGQGGKPEKSPCSPSPSRPVVTRLASSSGKQTSVRLVPLGQRVGEPTGGAGEATSVRQKTSVGIA